MPIAGVESVKRIMRALLGAASLTIAVSVAGPAGAAAAPPGAAATNNVFSKPRFPVRPHAAAAVIAAGKALFSANCSFCHGSNARGGESGPNLLRSDVVLNDQNGEQIAKVVQNGRVDQGMPRFSLTLAQISQIAAFLHSMPLVNRTAAADVNPVTGNARAGAAFFSGPGGCAACHSVTGDLAGIGAKYAPRALERAMLSGNWSGSGFSAVPNMVPPGTTAVVELPSGRRARGRLASIDEFSISLIAADGERLTFERHGNTPEVTIHNPLSAHLTLLRTLTDAQVHDLTAYLTTLK